MFSPAGMAEEDQDQDQVSEYLHQNPSVALWVESFRGYFETRKMWSARREFILKNMEAFPAVQPGHEGADLDRLLSLSMAWTNHVFMGCR